ncbi:MAG: tetratricopeptide repeat protein [Patescibacteria group bacterium]
MIVYFVIGAIIILCVAIIAIIIIGKFPKLSALDLDAMKHHKHAQVKVSIVEERLERKMKELGSLIQKFMRPLFSKIISWFKQQYQKIVSLEKKYREEKLASSLKQEDKESLRQKNNTLIAEAEKLIHEEKYGEAEKKYIEVISLDKQNIEAYKGLAELYIIKKDHDLAVETLNFIKQINPNDDGIWRQLGNINILLDKADEAVKCYKKSVDLAPNSPKNLDLLIETSLKVKDKYLAITSLKKLEEVNPENNKLNYYKKQVAEL